MARAQKEAVAIILDIGRSSTTAGSKFLERAKECVTMVLKRKIFASAKDEVILIVIGSDETDNNLNYNNIKVAYPLSLPSWEMIEYVGNIKTTSVNADWLDGIVIAMDALKEQATAKQFVEKKIVLFSDLESDVSEDQVETIIKYIGSEGYNLYVIGPDVNLIKEDSMDINAEEIFGNEMNSKLSNGKVLLSKILKEVGGGVICSFSDAVPQLMYLKKKTVSSVAWNVVLDVGPDIKIPVSGYKKISPSTLPTWKIVLPDGSHVESERSYTIQDENQTVVDRDDVIDAFCYGTTLVPLSDIDKETMSYKSGNKCLSILGFTKSVNVPRHLLIGNSVMYIVPRRGDEAAAYALSALINAMKDENLYAIARRVYIDNAQCFLGVLIPKISSKVECLAFVELPYSEDMREFTFPPLITDSSRPTPEQVEAIDALIDSMDLTAVRDEFGDKSEAFKSKNILNPYHQHVYQSLAFKALNPKAPLPPVTEDVMRMLTSPYENSPLRKLALEKVKDNFLLTDVKPKTSRSAAQVFKKDKGMEGDPNAETSGIDLKDTTLTSLIQSSVVEVGSVKPAEDFKLLLDKGEPLDKICGQIQKVILNLVVRSFGSDSFDKADAALKVLRSTCAARDPSIYNEWLVKLRDTLFERNKKSFWDIIVKNNLGLISTGENSNSLVNDVEARKFLEYEEPKEDAAQDDDDMDAEDLLNEM